MSLTRRHCPECNSENFKRHCRYKVKSGEPRTLFLCQSCRNYFSETKNTPLGGLKTAVSRISLVLEAINDGMGLNAACRTFQVGKNTIKRWVNRLGGLKESLLLYVLCHQFIQLQIEGDELYTKVTGNKPAPLSEGWTVVLMDRASRFIWDMQCSERNADLFKQAIATLAQVIEQTDDLNLFTDGERRYGNLLFEICQEVIRTGSDWPS
jgi:transposase-like protein